MRLMLILLLILPTSIATGIVQIGVSPSRLSYAYEKEDQSILQTAFILHQTAAPIYSTLQYVELYVHHTLPIGLPSFMGNILLWQKSSDSRFYVLRYKQTFEFRRSQGVQRIYPRSVFTIRSVDYFIGWSFNQENGPISYTYSPDPRTGLMFLGFSSDGNNHLQIGQSYRPFYKSQIFAFRATFATLNLAPPSTVPTSTTQQTTSHLDPFNLPPDGRYGHDVVRRESFYNKTQNNQTTWIMSTVPLPKDSYVKRIRIYIHKNFSSDQNGYVLLWQDSVPGSPNGKYRLLYKQAFSFSRTEGIQTININYGLPIPTSVYMGWSYNQPQGPISLQFSNTPSNGTHMISFSALVLKEGLVYDTAINTPYIFSVEAETASRITGVGIPGEKGIRGLPGPPGDRGSTGDRGQQGSQGSKGIRGILGVLGQKGEIGLKGTKGNLGMKGQMGDPGVKGDRGIKGMKGEIGEKGFKGIEGDKGRKGGQGVPGAPGLKGEKGMKGESGIKGDNGIIVGDKGNQGGTGRIGSKGVKGTQGEQGDKGPPGAGPPGDTGDKGEKGETGTVQGPTGIPGDQGEKGDDGPVGDIGPTGETGAPGELGPKGPIGPQGILGVRGQTGDIGVPGRPGPFTERRGPKGNRGPKGDKGPRGIKGESGNPGDRGVKGTPGDPGQKGDPGIQGPAGSRGSPGVKGPRGDKGLMGPQGGIGPRGAKGIKGGQGIKGMVGSGGLQGIQGAIGNKGEIGITGPPGTVGEVGPMGPQGVQGDVGSVIDDYCSRNNGGCQGICINTFGSRLCGCSKGFRLQNDSVSCEDIDECMENNPCDHICINIPGSVVCDCMGGYTPDPVEYFRCHKWELVFVATHGAPFGAYNLYTSDSTRNEGVSEAVALNNTRNDHYKSSVVNNWEKEYITKVKVAIYRYESEAAFFIFDGHRSDRYSWFNKSRLLSTSYNKSVILTEPQNFFSISGDLNTAEVRRFLISRNYGGCINDQGWILVVDGRQQRQACSVDDVYTTAIYYSNLQHHDYFKNKCSHGNGGCSHHCHNMVGGRFCSCPSGYSLGSDFKTCADINECSMYHPCQQRCTNNQAGFQCSCYTGYIIDVSDPSGCQDLDECSSPINVCQDKQQCINTAGSFVCVDSHIVDNRIHPTVQSGAGIQCSVNNGGCAQQCHASAQGRYCTCYYGYRLMSDSIRCSNVDECAQYNPCEHNCIDESPGYRCTCNPGFFIDNRNRHKCVVIPSNDSPDLDNQNGVTLPQQSSDHHRTQEQAREDNATLQQSVTEIKIMLLCVMGGSVGLVLIVILIVNGKNHRRRVPQRTIQSIVPHLSDENNNTCKL